MSDRRRVWTLLAATGAAVLALGASTAALAATGAPPATARDLSLTYFSNSLIRAEVVTMVGQIEHDYRVDEGKVVAVRPNAIDLFERDGTRQTIAIGAQTRIVGVGRLFGPGKVAKGIRVVTLRDGSGPALQVRSTAWARVLGRSLFGSTLVRAEILNYIGQTVHDYRMDEGRIVAVKPATLTLLERDGTRQVIPISSTTLVSMLGQPVDQSAIVKGLSALTIREGDGPAEQIMLANGPFVVRK